MAMDASQYRTAGALLRARGAYIGYAATSQAICPWQMLCIAEHFEHALPEKPNMCALWNSVRVHSRSQRHGAPTARARRHAPMQLCDTHPTHPPHSQIVSLFSMWLMWACVWMHQWHPIILPVRGDLHEMAAMSGGGEAVHGGGH